MNLVGDEFNIIMKCDKYKDLRVDFIEKISNLEEKFSNLEREEKFIFIMRLDNKVVKDIFPSFIKNIIAMRGIFFRYNVITK